MIHPVAADWEHAYGHVVETLPLRAANAPLTLCGMSACVDARVSMHAMTALLDTDVPQAAAFASMLKARARRGVGGEVFVDWPEGPQWLETHVPLRYALGGTGPHAAWVLSTLGAPALLALADRSAHMLARLPPDVLLADGGRLIRAETATPAGERRPEIFIFEYTAGLPVGDVMPARSSRIIVRFDNLGLENDRDFARLTPDLARNAGAGLISGFSAVSADRLGVETERVFSLVRAWRAAGLGTVHFELAGYDSIEILAQVLDACRGVVTSIGMSHSEFRSYESDAEDLGAAMMRFGERLRVRRVCVHADHWAASVTRDDPEIEREALLTGCLLASARAIAGRPVRPARLDPAARFHDLPFEPLVHHDGWHWVACASPYHDKPLTTLGLGDTFTGGCLLALGQRAGRKPRADALDGA